MTLWACPQNRKTRKKLGTMSGQDSNLQYVFWKKQTNKQTSEPLVLISTSMLLELILSNVNWAHFSPSPCPL